ncbi:Cupredoxin [Fennellomyces sp. T-0311]|nr:Cupredoxin [Fennellomyces sp. T-0311]
MMVLLLLSLIIGYVATVTHGYDTHYFELNITREIMDPDCSGYHGGKLVANGQLPGPTLQVTTGDRVRILVRNLLPKDDPTEYPETSAVGGMSNDITVHYHGIRQFGSPAADGVPFLTQDPIKPQQTYLYDFTIDQAGTFFYHAHVATHDESLFGPLIVHERYQPYDYDDERVIAISEWWHQTAEEMTDYLLGPNFTAIPEPQSILLNGRTMYDPNWPHGNCHGYSVISVDPDKTYRLRIIGATAFRTIGFAIAHHELTVIEVDGTLVKPFDVPFLEVSPGQRFSVLLKPLRRRRGDFTINTIRRWAADVSNESNGVAVLRYTKKPTRNDKMIYATGETFNFPTDTPYWYWSNIEPVDPVPMIASVKPSRTIVLKATSARLPTGELRWYLNNSTFTDPEETILESILTGKRQRPTITSSGYDPYLGTYPVQYLEVIDFVLQSTHVRGQPCRSHPWHTHGHSFWEIAYGQGMYNETADADVRNVPTPFLRDVTLVYPVEDLAIEYAAKPGAVLGCGWNKIRIIADNPGIWPIHCHNTPHMIMGMMIALEEAPEMIVNPYVQLP